MGRLLAIVLPVLILFGMIILAFPILSLMAPTPEKNEEPDGGLNVFAERVVKDDLHLVVKAQGEVRPKREITVAPQISGRISYVSPAFIDGGFIRKGQLLVRLEAEDYELAVVRAQSGVASAEQRLLREQAEAELALQDLEELGLTDASALARREPQLAEARASLEAARAQLQDARLALKRTGIYAPFAGRVRERNANIGQIAATGQPLGRIFATDVVEVYLPLNDAQLGRLHLPLAFNASKDHPGPRVTFSATVGGQPRSWVGEVKRTAAAVNSQTRQINVIAELDDPFGKGMDGDAPMAPGLFVSAIIEGETLHDVYRVPRAALRGDDKLYIGLPKEGRLSIRSVDILHSDPQGAWLADGVEEGELAITSPIQAPFDGMSITVLERMPDGSVKTHTPEHADKKETDDGEASAAIMSAEDGARE